MMVAVGREGSELIKIGFAGAEDPGGKIPMEQECVVYWSLP